MSERLSISAQQREELCSLAGKLHDGILTAAERDRLESLIVHDDDAAAFCAGYADVHAMLRWRFRPLKPDSSESSRENAPVAPSVAGDHRPVSIVPMSVLQGTTNSFASGWPAAYLVATLICAIGLAIGALVHVSQPERYASPHNSARTPDPYSQVPNPSTIVGRITGMVDCVLNHDECRMLNAELKTDIQHSSFITQHPLIYLGDAIALRSGLLEITYDTGARVILQGPVTYEVESSAGGYLSIGRLTAKLEQKSEVRGPRSGSGKSEIRNHQSEILCRPHAHRSGYRPGHGVRRGSGPKGNHYVACLPWND